MTAGLLCGFLNVNKPAGPTSNDVVEDMKRALGARCGHAGTLDPLASGVLALGVGEARKFIAFLDHDKEYEAVMRLGQESTTLDREGELSPPKPVEASPEEIRAAGDGLTGELELPVPLFSAVHSGGKRLHEMARAGEAVTPPIRKCHVSRIDITSLELPLVKFRVACSGGTYVRSIASEWGRQLGCGALLESLVRTRSGPFKLADSRTPEEIQALAEKGSAAGTLVPLARALAGLPLAGFDDASLASLRHGRHAELPAGTAASGAFVLLGDRAGGIIGVGRVVEGRASGIAAAPERLLAEGMEAA